MNAQKILLTYGALLHDVGKVVYRGISEQGTHSKLGADFIEEVLNGNETSIRHVSDQLRYHHKKELVKANIGEGSLVYITYFADNISAGMDRKDEGTDTGFDRSAKLRKIFNILNGHHDDNTLEHDDYNAIRKEIKKELSGTAPSEERIGSILNLLERTCATVPSSTDKSQLIDVSLFDHLKTTAAIACCIYDYLVEQGVTNYKEALFDKSTSDRYYDKPMFLLWSCDMSGIQDFIYQISGTKALKQLRARSFYLEMLLEHSIDELLERLDLSRANLLYTGGGHAYALFPNTTNARAVLEQFAKDLKNWMIENFGIDLYCACAYVPCCANDLKNQTARSAQDATRYRALFRALAKDLSKVKQTRYTAADIAAFNFSDLGDVDASRECSECHKSNTRFSSDEDDICELCGALRDISNKLVKCNVFTVSDSGVLPLPFGGYLTCYTKESYLQQKPKVKRVYTKNEWNTGDYLSTHIWMGDYTADQHNNSISDYATYGVSSNGDTGIKRLGVLRADVDNLGAVFTQGIPDSKISISRTATLSRELSYFFKNKINEILAESEYRAQIIYSGGDDLFIIGNWCDVIYAALDIKKALDEFTGNGVLTISAGIGMYDDHYPIARMAAEVGELEDAAKAHPGKNAVVLWAQDNVFSWDELQNEILPMKDKLAHIFAAHDKGASFIYQMLSLLRDSDHIAVPRLAYLLARSFEDKEAAAEQNIKTTMYTWATNEQKKKHLICALEWYVYSVRERS